jgi:hypothetical protein
MFLKPLDNKNYIVAVTREAYCGSAASDIISQDNQKSLVLNISKHNIWKDNDNIYITFGL